MGDDRPASRALLTNNEDESHDESNVSAARKASQLRELSNEELDAVAGGITAIAKPVSPPAEYLTITLENTMVSG
jgi:hypothetical protein